MSRSNISDSILDAADRLLARYGYKKMSMDDLASELGISKATIYQYFASKEEIALSNYDRVIERLKTELKLIAEKNLAPEDRIRQMLYKRVLHRFDAVHHYTDSLDDILRAMLPKIHQRRKLYLRAEAEIFASVIGEGQKTKKFVAGNPHEFAVTLLIATNSLLPTVMTARELGRRTEVEKTIGRLADLVLMGMVERS